MKLFAAAMMAAPILASAQAADPRPEELLLAGLTPAGADGYRVGADGVQAQPLLVQKTAGKNLYSRPDCVDRLRDFLTPMAPPDGRDEQVPPGQCCAISAGWLIGANRMPGSPGPLTLHFRGAISKANKDANLPAQVVDQHIKFEFRGGRYVPVSGSNPIPDA